MGCGPSQPAPFSSAVLSGAESQKDEEGSVRCCQVEPWPGCPLPPDEAKRLAATEAMQLIGQPPDELLQHYVALCCRIFDMPISLVSMLGKNCAHITNSPLGFPIDTTDRRFTPCAWVLAPKAPEVLIAEDMQQDARFSDFELVAGEPHLRFYAGAPLILSAGFRVGVLCVLDTKPRKMDSHACNMLANLAEMMARDIELRCVLSKSREGRWSFGDKQPRRPKGCYEDGLMVLDTTCDKWRIMHVNSAMSWLTGSARQELMQMAAWDLFAADTEDAPWKHFAGLVRDGESFEVQVSLASDTSGKRFTLDVRPAQRAEVDRHMGHCPQVGIPSWLPDEIEGLAGSRGYYFASLTPLGRPKTMRQVASVRSAASFLAQLGVGPKQEPAAGQSAFAKRSASTQRSLSLPMPDTLPEADLGMGAGGGPGQDPVLQTSLSSEAALSDADIGGASSLERGSNGASSGSGCAPAIQQAFATLPALPSTEAEAVATSQQQQAGALAATTSAPRTLAEPSRLASASSNDSSLQPASTPKSASEQDSTVSADVQTPTPFSTATAGSSPFATTSTLLPFEEEEAEADQRAGSASAPGPAANPFDEIKLGPLLGWGSFGRVYRARWRDTPVAVKVIDMSRKSIKKTADGLPWEVALTQGLDHPNIVRIMHHINMQPQGRHALASSMRRARSLQDGPGPAQAGASAAGGSARDEFLIDTGDDRPNYCPLGLLPSPYGKLCGACLILEFCNRGSLADAIDKGWFLTKRSHNTGRPDMGAVLCTLLDIARALRYLHAKSIVHGDLSGGNVLLTEKAFSSADQRGFEAKVADFGLSRVLESEKREAACQGTITHMPPEMLRHNKLGPATDVYSFGVLCWEIYVGQRAWAGLGYFQIMHTVAYEGKQPEFPVTSPPGLVALARRCLDPDSASRPAFTSIVADLEQLAADLMAGPRGLRLS